MVATPKTAVDTIVAGDGNDHIFGGRGGEEIWPGPGDDVVRGGPYNGWNTIVFFEGATSGVKASLARHFAVGDGRDELHQVAWLVGTSYDDLLEGDEGANGLQGCGGADLMIGRGGADFIQGDDLDPEGDGCPGDPSSGDLANGGGGYDRCAADEMRRCEERDYDLTGGSSLPLTRLLSRRGDS